MRMYISILHKRCFSPDSCYMNERKGHLYTKIRTPFVTIIFQNRITIAHFNVSSDFMYKLKLDENKVVCCLL